MQAWPGPGSVRPGLGVCLEVGGAVLGSRGRLCTHNAGKIGVFGVRHGGIGGDRGLDQAQARCSGRGEAGRVRASRVKAAAAAAAAQGAAKEAEEQETSREVAHRKLNFARTARCHAPWRGRDWTERAGNEVMARPPPPRIMGFVVSTALLSRLGEGKRLLTV